MDDDSDLFDVKEAASVDVHDLSDAGMEAVAMERAAMMAEEYRESHSQPQGKKAETKSVVEKVKSIFRHDLNDNDEDLLEAEEEAAYDAHDLSDAGMEAVAMERAVMMAEEYRESHSHPQKANVDELDVPDVKASHDSDIRTKSVEEHYNSVEKDITEIENLIKRAAEADQLEV